MPSNQCTTCDRELNLSAFPRHPKGSNCQHGRDTCKRCWRQWLAAQVNTKRFDQISCAQCDNILGQSEIRALSDRKAYDKYLDSELSGTLAADENFRWCIAPLCKSGQVHDGGDIFRCTSCGFKACVSCNVAWHEGETCEARQGRITARSEEEERSTEALKICSKLCPGCDRKVQKNGGCDHIHCTMCGYDSCYVCLADQKTIWREGNSAHDRACVHWRENAVFALQARPFLSISEDRLLENTETFEHETEDMTEDSFHRLRGIFD